MRKWIMNRIVANIMTDPSIFVYLHVKWMVELKTPCFF